MSEAQNNKDVYKIYNNAHYQLLDKKENFSLIVNKALGNNRSCSMEQSKNIERYECIQVQI